MSKMLLNNSSCTHTGGSTTKSAESTFSSPTSSSSSSYSSASLKSLVRTHPMSCKCEPCDWRRWEMHYEGMTAREPHAFIANARALDPQRPGVAAFYSEGLRDIAAGLNAHPAREALGKPELVFGCEKRGCAVCAVKKGAARARKRVEYRDCRGFAAWTGEAVYYNPPAKKPYDPWGGY